MANYPTTVFGPATRNNGQVIDASHVNDLQAEVTAVESGLLGTIAHSVNISGASSLATLNVSGGSTLGTVNAGNSTVAALSVSGGSSFASRPVMPPPEAAVVYGESSGAIGSSGLSTLAFTGTTFQSNSSMHSTGTNPERLVPQSTGLYLFQAQILLGGAPAGASHLRLLLMDSSNTQIAANGYQGVSAQGYLQVSGYKRFDALGGYVTAVFANVSGSTFSLSTGASTSWFSMVKL